MTEGDETRKVHNRENCESSSIGHNNQIQSPVLENSKKRKKRKSKKKLDKPKEFKISSIMTVKT